MIDQIDDILFYLRDSDSKKPMQAEKLAAKLEVSMPRFEEMMNIICNIVPAPVNRAYREVTENIEKNIKAFKGYVYWPTGVIDKAHWKDFKPASSKPAAQPPIRTENSIPKVSADTYETPVFITKEATDPIADDMVHEIANTPALVTVAAAEPDYSDKPKAYRILKFIESFPGSTSRDIQNAIGLPGPIDGYISPYLEHIEILPKTGGRVFTLKKPVDEFYNHRKVAEKKQLGAPKNEVSEIPQQPQETTATGAVDAQPSQDEPKGAAVPEVSEQQNHQAEVVSNRAAEDEPARYRFAYTNDGCLMLMTFGHLPVELNRHETQLLISFLDDQLTLMRVA